jgi:hypothetical protein
VLKHCLRHAVNNLLGSNVLTTTELDREAELMRTTAPARVRGSQRTVPLRYHDRVDGSYTFAAVQQALTRRQYQLRHWSGRPYVDVCSMTEGKFLVCIEYGVRDSDGGPMTHVIGVDCDRRLLLDSQDRGPLPLSETLFLRKTQPNRRYPETRIFRAYHLERRAEQPRGAATAGAPSAIPVAPERALLPFPPGRATDVELSGVS